MSFKKVFFEIKIFLGEKEAHKGFNLEKLKLFLVYLEITKQPICPLILFGRSDLEARRFQPLFTFYEAMLIFYNFMNKL